MTERGRLDGQVAFVTGAGGGIGRALALGLAAAGADVALFEIIPERAEETAARIAELGRQALVLPGDAMDTEALRSAIAATDELRSSVLAPEVSEPQESQSPE